MINHNKELEFYNSTFKDLLESNYSYAFKPKKGSQLWIEQDGSNIELV